MEGRISGSLVPCEANRRRYGAARTSIGRHRNLDRQSSAQRLECDEIEAGGVENGGCDGHRRVIPDGGAETGGIHDEARRTHSDVGSGISVSGSTDSESGGSNADALDIEVRRAAGDTTEA